MKHIALAAALALPLPLAAQTPCAMSDAAPIDVLEPAKAAFLAGEFDAFTGLVTALFPQARETFDPAMKSLGRAFPEGFGACQTVFQRREAGGLMQEITVFFDPDGAFQPISLYLVAAPLGDKNGILYLNFNSSFETVFEEVR